MAIRNLSEQDIKILKTLNYSNSDIIQIDKAVTKTNYTLDNKRISHKEARVILGDDKFLSGIARSAFHFTAARETNNKKLILFDSSRLFKKLDL